MVKINAIAVVLVLLLAVVLTGCKQGDTVGGITTPFVGGNQGLKVTLREGAPPSTVFDNGKYPFSIIVDLENLGESDVPAQEAAVDIIGLYPEHFGLSGTDSLVKRITIDLPGVKKNFEGTILPGDRTAVAFENLNYKNDLQGNTQINFRARVCYNYETRSTTQICIKDDILGNVGDDAICKLNEIKKVYNSGAPVSVKEVKESPMGQNKVQLLITIGHTGTGSFFRPATTLTPQSCDPSLTNIDKNVVEVKVYLPNTQTSARVSCTGLESAANSGTEGFFALYGGTDRKFSCIVESSPGGRNVYQELLHVDLTYTYGQSLDSTLLIQDVSDGSQ